MQICRYCQKEIPEGEAKSTNSYWHAVEDVCHKNCKNGGIKEEAYECQCIDADCNDCKHFKRVHYFGSPYKYSKGYCIKLDKAVSAFAVTWTGHLCFEHRRGLPIKTM